MAVSPRLLAWLPVAVVLLLMVWLVAGVRLTVIPELQQRAQGDLQRRAEVMAERIRSQLDTQWRDLRQLARVPLLSHAGQALPGARAELEWLLEQQPAFVWIGLVAGDGRVLAATRGWLEGQSVAQQAAFGRAWQNGHFLGDFHAEAPAQPHVVGQDRVDPQVFDLAVRLHDVQGRPRGVLVAHLGARWLQALQRDAQAGLPAGHSLQARVWIDQPPRPLPESLTSAAASAAPPFDALRSWVHAGGLGPPPAATLAALQRVAAPLSAGEVAWHWQVLVTRDRAEALSPADPLVAAIAGPGLLAAILLGVTGFWLTRRVTKPWQALIDAAERAAPGSPLGRYADAVHEVLAPARTDPDQVAQPPAAGAAPDALLARLAADARYIRRVLDHLPVGVVLSGRGLAIEHVNATLTRQLGWTSEAVRGQLDGGFLCHSTEGEPLAAQLRAMAASPGELVARFTARQADGAPRAVQWHFVPLFDDSGTLEGGLSVVIDIDAETTARRRAAALDQRLRLLLEVAVDHALVLLDEDGRVLSWNVGAASVFGHTAPQAMGSAFEDLFESDARAIGLPQRLLQQAHAAGRSPIDGPLRHAGGRRLHGVGSLYAMPAQAWPAGYALIARDVTEEQAAALRLAESETRLAAVVGGASDAIVSVDELGRVKLFNPAAEQIFGRSADSVLGRPLDELLPDEARQAHGLAIKAFQRSGQSTRRMSDGQVWGVRADGARLALEASISQAQVDGRMVMTAILRDVTARLAAEQALQRYRDELADLSQRMLEQERETTRRLAQTLHDELGQTITAMRLNFDACRSVFPTEGTFAQRLERLNGLIATGYRQVREALVELRPPLLDDLGLAPALENEMAVRRVAHPEVQLQLTLPSRLEEQRWPTTVEYAAFMIAREALQNALQHSGAAAVGLTLDGDERRLCLEVMDDGIGLPLAGASKPGHLGLVGMRERALAIGAQFKVAPRGAGGTAVRLEWEDKPMAQTP